MRVWFYLLLAACVTGLSAYYQAPTIWLVFQGIVVARLAQLAIRGPLVRDKSPEEDER